eukprot:6245364-Prymnesium_polylepis.1
MRWNNDVLEAAAPLQPPPPLSSLRPARALSARAAESTPPPIVHRPANVAQSCSVGVHGGGGEEHG